jgi:hypothetical protein
VGLPFTNECGLRHTEGESGGEKDDRRSEKVASGLPYAVIDTSAGDSWVKLAKYRVTPEPGLCRRTSVIVDWFAEQQAPKSIPAIKSFR